MLARIRALLDGAGWFPRPGRRRWERRQLHVAARTGQVLDQESVTRYLRELRHGDRD